MHGWDFEPDSKVEKFVEEKNLKQKVLMHGGRVASEKFGVRPYPTSYWLDHKGKVLTREIGFNPAKVPEMERRIEELLEKRKKDRENAG